MVSFWPFKNNDTSPASFEKSLSTIAKKIIAANARLESSRQQSRRFKALWTLYTSIAYLLYCMIVALVVGLKHSGIAELGGLVGGPLLIFGVRQGISSFYAYRTASQQAYLESLQKQRDIIIKKLKEATRYDSTQQLLEKYGGTPAKSKRDPSNKKPIESQERMPSKTGRTMVVPPPTANIARAPLSAPNTPQRQADMSNVSQPPFTAAAATPPWPQQQSPISPLDSSAEFAPNAFPPANYYAQPGSEFSSGRWYDRLMDVLLGEDESHPKNRIVLICKQCRLVNGQAPPGVKSLADVGKWRCSACGFMNGDETEVQKIVAEIKNEQQLSSSEMVRVEEASEEEPTVMDQNDDQSDVAQESEDEVHEQDVSVSTSRETRSARARKNRKQQD